MSADLAYPIGPFEAPAVISAAAREEFVGEIAAAPAALRKAVEGLDDRQLDTPYRPGGWTVRQVVHHLPDSHLNAYVRFKLALTEEEPTIRLYDEGEWARLPEASSGPVSLSLDLLGALHRRWLACIRALPAPSFERTFRHPELGVMSLNRQLALYAWHGRHHVAHITALAAREKWA
ncbi:MAG: YfiT family bacillithiol transferase [Thermoanaerobaculia bacterium]